MSLRISQQDRVRRITLARPEKRNALNEELCRGLVDAFAAADADPAVGCVLLEAEGQVFCAGMDLDDARRPDAAQRTLLHERLFTLITRIRIPVVAAINGPALAGGLGLVANAHIAIAAQGAQFGLTEIRIGMWPFVVFRAIVAAAGERRALELSLTGRIFGVNEALQYGLIHEVTPAVELEDRALAIAETLAGFSRETVRRGLDFVQQSSSMGRDDAGRLAAMMRAENFSSPDLAEGIRAFQEKRRPQWPSHEWQG